MAKTGYATPPAWCLLLQNLQAVFGKTEPGRFARQGRFFAFKPVEQGDLEHGIPCRDGIFGYHAVKPAFNHTGREEKIGLAVDSFLSSYDTVVKSLGMPLERLSVFNGVTVSEKGEVILIVDVDRLHQPIEYSSSHPETTGSGFTVHGSKLKYREATK